MPLFDYTCQSCGDKAEELVPMNAPETLICDCGGEREREIGLPSFVLNFSDPLTGENKRAPMDNAEEVWGQPTDGANEAQYKSTKQFYGT